MMKDWGDRAWLGSLVGIVAVGVAVGWWSSCRQPGIRMFERYGVEWGAADAPIALTKQATLRAPFVEGRAYRFTPLVRNESRELLKHAEVWIKLEPGASHSGWACQADGWCGVGLPPIGPQRGMSAGDSLWLRFHDADTYLMEGRVSGVWRGREITVPAHWTFTLE